MFPRLFGVVNAAGTGAEAVSRYNARIMNRWKRGFWPWLWLWCGTFVFVPGAVAEEEDPAIEAAVSLLRRCVSGDEEGQGLILAIRRMRDPSLEPLFRKMLAMPDPNMKGHGLLGLVEVGLEKELTVEQVAAIRDPLIQLQVLSAAVADELLGDEQAQQFMASPEIFPSAKLSVATQLLQHRKGIDLTHARRALETDKLRQLAMALMVLVQSGDEAAAAQLVEFRKRDDKSLDPTCALVLDTATKCHFDRIGPWAMQIVEEKDVERNLQAVALRTALRLKTPGAADDWRRRFVKEVNLAQQLRLALAAMYAAPWVDASLFSPMLGSSYDLIQQLGFCGQAVARQENISEVMVDLIRMNNSAANRWAASYASQQAADQDARAIWLALIQAVEEGARQDRLSRLDLAILSTRSLHQDHTEASVDPLRAILTDPKSDPILVQGVLMGLLSSTKSAGEIVADLPPFEPRTVEAIALLVAAKGGRQLAGDQLKELGMMVRGGGRLKATVRVQAGWAYLKMAEAHLEALKTVLEL